MAKSEDLDGVVASQLGLRYFGIKRGRQYLSSMCKMQLKMKSISCCIVLYMKI